jgi:hypothetical protein
VAVAAPMVKSIVNAVVEEPVSIYTGKQVTAGLREPFKTEVTRFDHLIDLI